MTPWIVSMTLSILSDLHYKLSLKMCCALKLDPRWQVTELFFFPYKAYKFQFHANLISHCITLMTTNWCYKFMANVFLFLWSIVVTHSKKKGVKSVAVLSSVKYPRSPLGFPVSFQFVNVKCKRVCPSFLYIMNTSVVSLFFNNNIYIKVYQLFLLREQVKGLIQGLFKWMKRLITLD